MKRKRTKLVAIKQIPGLFLTKKINRRKKGKKFTPNVEVLEDRKEEIENDQLSETIDEKKQT